MALIQAAQNIGSFSDAVNFTDNFLGNVVRLRRLSAGKAPPFNTVNFNPKSDKEIFLNVTEDESLTYKVAITDKPVGNIGVTTDYIAREAEPLVLTSIISNRSFNVLSDPAQALRDIASTISPRTSAVLNGSASLAGNLFDLGGDEIDAKIRTIRGWQVRGEIVNVLGVRLDALNHISKNETFNYLVEEIALSYNASFGDNVGLTVTLKNLLNLDESGRRKKRGGKLGESLTGNIPPSINPFT